MVWNHTTKKAYFCIVSLQKKKHQNTRSCTIYFLVTVEPPPNLSEITGRLLKRNAILNFFVGKPQKSGQKHHGTCLDEKILKLCLYLERFLQMVREMCTNYVFLLVFIFPSHKAGCLSKYDTKKMNVILIVCRGQTILKRTLK